MDAALLPVFIKAGLKANLNHVREEERWRESLTTCLTNLNFASDGQEVDERPSSGCKRFKLERVHQERWRFCGSGLNFYHIWRPFLCLWRVFGKAHFPAPRLRAGLRRSLSLSPSFIKPTSQSPHLISTWANLSGIKGCSHKNTWKSLTRFCPRPCQHVRLSPLKKAQTTALPSPALGRQTDRPRSSST